LDFTEAKRNKQIFPDLYYTTGEMYYRLGQYDSAIVDLEIISNYMKDNHTFYAMLGDCYLFTAHDRDSVRFNKAITYFTKSLLIEESIQVLRNRAFAYDKLELDELAAKDRDRLYQIQLEKGFNPESMTFKTLVGKDGFFNIKLPAT